tara:strand:+ start:304 stop:501 length:198 start_codon:yes stop_codon:yes gene_type:complete
LAFLCFSPVKCIFSPAVSEINCKRNGLAAPPETIKLSLALNLFFLKKLKISNVSRPIDSFAALIV